jgi:hypothetical protein
MRWLTGHLNDMGRQGWRLHLIFEQDKNTVMVFERDKRPWPWLCDSEGPKS